MSHAKSILVAYDGSEGARRALDAAAQLMGYGSTLAVVGAGPDPLADAAHYLTGRHVSARYVEANGHPSETVLSTAVDVGADVIVLAALNSLLESVIDRARCDVLVVR